ncbi:DNA polymerase eta-like [Clavelina lepadiformis]|uniref:DNA polymerase eta n=1 Tax=Clavelina lepadiformis TaxID=159417 RepID=A0ABP0FX52_CLALP
MNVSATKRIVVLIDMDCFYVQVEQRRDPTIRGMPCAVVQYNQWKGGGIIAVSYEARDKGVTRNMRGDDAKQKCPEIVLCMVPTANGKADLTRYRDAGAEVIQVLLQFGGVVERASIDEAYIDLTDLVEEKIKNAVGYSPSLNDLQHTYLLGCPTQHDSGDKDKEVLRIDGLTEYMEQTDEQRDNLRLLIAASLVEDMRSAIYAQTSFRCSAGISHNKVLSKLACGINKPNKQTILPLDGVPGLFRQIKIGKIRNLGGKLGQTLTTNFGIEFIGQLTDIPKQTLLENYGSKTGQWLYEICRGMDNEPVKERHIAQSVGCSKTFSGAEALDARSKVKKWLRCLATELVERLTKDRVMNYRTAKGLTAYVGLQGRKSVSRACPMEQYDVERIAHDCLCTLEQLNELSDPKTDIWFPAITVIGISAKNFVEVSGGQSKGKKKRVSMDAYVISPSKQKAKDTADSNVVESHYFEKKTGKSADSSTPKSDKEYKSEFLKLFQSPKTSGENIKSTSSIEKTNVQQKGKGNPHRLKQSFFAQMKSIKSDKMPVCKIEEEYLKENRKEDQENHCDDLIGGEIPTKDCKITETSSSTQQQANDAGSSNNQTSAKGSKPTPVLQSYDMGEVDMDIFNSLPAYIQHEIKISSQKSQSNSQTKQGKGENGQASISGFLSQVSPSFDNPPVSNKTSKKSVTKSRKKGRKGDVSFKADLSNAVPLGFFRARTQASSAIRNAVEKRAQKRKLESTGQEENKTSRSVKPCPDIPKQRSTPVENESTLWSCFLNEECYYCDICKTSVPVRNVGTHGDFHAQQGLL